MPVGDARGWIDRANEEFHGMRKRENEMASLARHLHQLHTGTLYSRSSTGHSVWNSGCDSILARSCNVPLNPFKPRQGLDEIITFSCPSGGCQEPRCRWYSEGCEGLVIASYLTSVHKGRDRDQKNSKATEVLRRHRSTWPKHVTSTIWMPEPLRHTAKNT